MGAKDKRQKLPKIVDAELTEDGMLLIEMNIAFKMGNSKKILLPPETLLALGETYASMPPATDTDYPGIPILEETDIFDEDEDPDQGETEEDTAEE